ncbi:MAG TPA: hypothetical protein VK506_12195 [Conexibacter sp.]|nr:hypothetical protein [Conexibacter sp.]
MRIGVVAEIKPAERRVALTPAGAAEDVWEASELLVKVKEPEHERLTRFTYLHLAAQAGAYFPGVNVRAGEILVPAVAEACAAGGEAVGA